MERKAEKLMKQTGSSMELKKHVAVIHSSNKLSLLQRKIANALLFNAYPHLHDRDEHTIHIGKLCQLIGYDSNDHKIIKRALVNLLSTVLEWNLVDGERLDTEGIWNASSIIADASIDGAICNYSYSNKMRKLLYRPNIYGRLDMYVQARFQSTYGLALYENCNRFQDIGQTPWFDLEKFRKLMGVEESKYKIFRDFKTRVLDKAVEEVNKYSALAISSQLKKINRRVVSIQFLIKKKNSSENNLCLLIDHSLTLNDTLQKKYGLSDKQIGEVLKNYDEKYIKEKIDLIESSTSFKNGRVKNFAKYLLSALRDNYQPTKTRTNNTSEMTKDKLDEIKPVKQDFIKRIEFKRYQDKQLFELFNKLPDRNQSTIIKKFEKFLTGMYQVVYSRDGLKNLLVQEQLCDFLRKINHAIVTKTMTYDAWINDISNGLKLDYE